MKGSQEVRFDDPPLRDAGLFAITGPTGAGKSTLLDIITLALFCRVPRFDGKITTGEIEKAGSIITHHTSDAYAEVDYEAGGQVYRSTWSISKNSKGNLKDYDMTLAVLPSGEFEDLKRSEVPDRNEKIIGLKYDQFVRSILLSQGEFAKFLKSEAKERAVLLENITGTQIYRAIGKAAFEKAKNHTEHLKLLKAEINAFSILGEEEINNLKEQITADTANAAILLAELNKNTALAETLRRIDDLEKKLEDNHKQQESLKLKEVAFKEKQDRINRHEALIPYRQDIIKFKETTDKVLQYTSQLSDLQHQQNEISSIVQSLLIAASELTGTPLNLQNIVGELHSFSQKVRSLDESLIQLKQNGSSIRTRLNALLESNSNPISDQLRLSSNPEIQHRIATERIAVLKEVPQVTAPGNESHLIETSVNLNKESELLKNQLVLLERLNTLNQEVAHLNSETENSSKILLTLQKNEQIINSSISDLTQSITILKAEKERLFKISELESLRSELKEDEACPLCGSTEHPFVIHTPITEYSKLSLDIDIKENELKNTHTEWIKIKADIGTQSNKIDMFRLNSSEKIEEVTKLEKVILPEYKKLTPSDLSQSLINLTKKQQEVADLIADRQEYRFLKEVITIIEELVNATETFKIKSKERDALYKGKDVEIEISAILAKFESIQKKNIEVRTSIDIADKSLKDCKATSIQLEDKLKNDLLQLDYHSIDQAAAMLINDQEWQLLNTEKTNLIRTAEQLDTTHKNILADLTTLNESKPENILLSELNDTIKAVSIERDLLNIRIGAANNTLKDNDEKKALLDQKIKNLEQAEKTAEKWILLDHYIGDSTGNKYAKFAQQLSLEYLIHLANIRLRTLTDRYLLNMEPSEDSDLSIKDMYLGGTTRSVKTLSGGESFLVSLALALSLSDMASRNVRLDSLFIDEGFGTLDPESLEMALNTLEKLQSDSHKTIGIISHVEALKERIYTQIKVVRNTQGYSEISIIG